MTESGLGLPTASTLLPSNWEILTSPSADGVTNMAIDSALLDTVRAGTAVWRWYAWESPTISFGRNERVLGRFHPERIAAAQLCAVRRPTGGRALLHSQELTYSVTLPLPESRPWRPVYAAINEILRRALQRIGVPAVLSPGSGALRPEGPVCFEAPAEGELVVEGRKLVGSAVWRQGSGYLQHGSVLITDDQARLAEAACVALPAAPPAATLRALLPAVPPDELTALVRAAVQAVLLTHGELSTFLPTDDWALSVASHKRHLSDAGWLWRR